MSEERRNADYAHNFKPGASVARAESFAVLDKAKKMKDFLATQHGETPEHVALIKSEIDALESLARIQGRRYELLEGQRMKAIAA